MVALVPNISFAITRFCPSSRGLLFNQRKPSRADVLLGSRSSAVQSNRASQALPSLCHLGRMSIRDRYRRTNGQILLSACTFCACSRQKGQSVSPRCGSRRIPRRGNDHKLRRRRSRSAAPRLLIVPQRGYLRQLLEPLRQPRQAAETLSGPCGLLRMLLICMSSAYLQQPEHRSPLVRNMVELPRTLRVREGTFSCGDGSKLIAHLPSRSRQAFEPALVIKPLLLSKEVQIKRHLAGDEDPNDSG